MSEHAKMHSEAATPTSWRQMLDERQRKAIAFAKTYVRGFNHGTVGHDDRPHAACSRRLQVRQKAEAKTYRSEEERGTVDSQPSKPHN